MSQKLIFASMSSYAWLAPMPRAKQERQITDGSENQPCQEAWMGRPLMTHTQQRFFDGVRVSETRG
eukprot:4801654-Amphidinium_carterae.1